MLPGVGGFPIIPRQSQPGTQTFSSPGTFSFTVPLYSTMTIKIWGAGGSGGNAFSGGSSSFGGEGGYYTEYTVAVGGLTEGASETIFIGEGGENRSGNVGGEGGQYSQFGNSVWAQGGIGGNGSGSGSNPIEPPLGRIYTPTNPRPAVFTLAISETGGTRGLGNSTPGGSVTYAGGGGGGCRNDFGGSAGGTSTFGGAGGLGGDGFVPARNASSPGGGGGGSDWDGGPSGAGGNGRIVISWT